MENDKPALIRTVRAIGYRLIAEEFRVNAIFFEARDPQLDAQVNLQGGVFGWAGTDIDGRDLLLPLLLWGSRWRCCSG